MNNVLKLFDPRRFYHLPCRIRPRTMWWKSKVVNSANRLNSLSRSRKIILGLLLMLVFMYYIVPKLFGKPAKHPGVSRVGGTECMGEKVYKYQSDVDSFDAVLNFVPPILGSKNYPPYVGNGYIAASFDSQNGLYIRLNRALSLPVMYYPVVDFRIEGLPREEVNVLQLRKGIANRIQTYTTGHGCISLESQLYAHRSQPSILVQDIVLNNPTDKDVYVDLDQIGESGWEGAKQSTDGDNEYRGIMTRYTVTSGVIKIKTEGETGGPDLYVAVSIATVKLDNKQELLKKKSSNTLSVKSAIHYTRAGELEKVKAEIYELERRCKRDISTAMKTEPQELIQQHTALWDKLWQSGFGISFSRASGALNGDKINSTIYYVMSNVPAPLHDPKTKPEDALTLRKTLHYPDKCYNGHTSFHSTTLWVDPIDEDSIARIVTTWIITLEKQGCQQMIQAGAEGVLQAMILSIGSLHFGHEHLEFRLHPKDTHRDFYFRRLNYGNNTHLNISLIVGEDNKATIFVALDRNDKPYYACDAGCLDPPVLLSNTWSKFPVKLTEPYTAILYVTSDKIHMEEYKHAIHVKEIIEAPAHEHHVIALHKHGHHFGGLPTIFWVSIAFLVIIFHLFLFKLIYNEYCQASERFTKSRYHV